MANLSAPERTSDGGKRGSDTESPKSYQKTEEDPNRIWDDLPKHLRIKKRTAYIRRHRLVSRSKSKSSSFSFCSLSSLFFQRPESFFQVPQVQVAHVEKLYCQQAPMEVLSSAVPCTHVFRHPDDYLLLEQPRLGLR